MSLEQIHTSLGSLAVEVDGKGPLVMMLHGSGSSRAAFDQQIPTLAGDRTVARWDAPGYGDSDDPPHAVSLAEYGQAVLEVVGFLSPERPVDLVGVSWGGLVAITAALQDQTAFRSLALIGSNFGQADDAAARARTQLRIDSFRASQADYVSERIDHLSRGNPELAPFPAIKERMLRTTRLPGFEYALHSMLVSAVADRLADITMPKLLMWGDADNVAGDVCHDMVERRLVDVHHIVVGAGHLANQEYPDVVNRHLRDFWQGIAKG